MQPVNYPVVATSSCETRNSSESLNVEKEVAGEENSNPDAIVGRIIFTTWWTLEMRVLSNGIVPPKWLEDRNDVWIRKCRIVNFDKALDHYDEKTAREFQVTYHLDPLVLLFHTRYVTTRFITKNKNGLENENG
jgi:hypothetical protein